MLSNSAKQKIALIALIPTCIFGFTSITTHLPLNPNAIHQNGPSSSVSSRLSLVSSTSTQDGITTRGPETGSPLNMICDERREFELNLGKAMDTLKKDYPDILTQAPDFSIFDEDLEVVDPSGVTIRGIKNYETSFAVVRTITGFFYSTEDSGLTFRTVFDCTRNSIRISWNAVLVPKAVYGGVRNQVHVDGISVYEMDRKTGMIIQHRVENLLVNGNPVHAPKGVVYALSKEVAGASVAGAGGFGIGQGSLPSTTSTTTAKSKGFQLEFRPPKIFSRGYSPLFTMTSSASSDDESGNNNNFDEDAYQRKNDTRRKYGLPSLSPEEFMKIEAEVRQLELVQQQKQQQAAQQNAAALAAEEKKKKRGSFLKNMMGDVLTDTCESNYDCERPMVCCDFMFKKVCCASGMKVMNFVPGQMQPLRVPIPAKVPRGGPDGFPEDGY